MKAGGAGGNGFVAAAALVRVLAALPDVLAVVAMFWLIPRAPATLPLSEAGTDMVLAAMRTVWPCSL
jgi:hypothetical protein